MRITFLGGAGEIGASCTLVEAGGLTLVIDCGIRMGASNSLPDLAPLNDRHVDAVIATHAHMDHTGALPVLAAGLAGVPVFMTPPTVELCRILLRDSVRLMHGAEREGEVPLYNERQVEGLFEAIVPQQVHAPLTIGDVTITLLPASHILGAAMVHLDTPEGSALFTGDYSVSAQLTVPALTHPTLRPHLIVTEATYGDRFHEDRGQAEARIVAQVREVLEAGGRVLIPAFAVGRAQEVLLILKRALRRGALPEVPVFVDGMVRAVCDVYGRHSRYVTRGLSHDIRKAAHPFYTNGVQPVLRPQDRQEVLRTGPCVIVASSGMLSGGASTFYAAELAKEARDAIFITGYQDEESPGRALLDLAEADGPGELRVGERVVPVACRVEKYGLSAHADRMQMVGLLDQLRPFTVAVVHGDGGARRALADNLACRDVVVAEDGLVLSRAWTSRREAGDATLDPGTLDADAARRLLGPPTDLAIPARRVAEALWGGRPSRSVVEALVRHLEGLELVRRDDDRKNLLWVLTPEESPALAAEAEEERALKEQNPKGRLLELCARRGWAPPETSFAVDGAHHVATSSLTQGEHTIESPPSHAATRKAAEQLAARHLLERLDEQDRPHEVILISADEAARLKRENPKTALLERAQAQEISPPTFDTRAVPGGFITQAQTARDGEAFASGCFQAAQRKAAEQAAAGDLIRTLSAAAANPDVPEAAPPAPTSPSPARPAGADARMQLNEMRQQGFLQSFGYEHRWLEGAGASPRFGVTAWAIPLGAARVETAEVSAPSKRAGERLAAEALVEQLRAPTS